MKFLYRSKQLILLTGDLLSYLIGFFLAQTVRAAEIPSLEVFIQHGKLFGITFGLWIVINYINGLYDLSLQTQSKRLYRRVGEAAGMSLILSVIFFYLFPKEISPKTILVLTVFFGYGLSLFLRKAAFLLLRLRPLHARVLFIGYSAEVKELMKILERKDNNVYDVKAIIHPEEISEKGQVDTYKTFTTIRPAISNHGIHIVVVAPDLQHNPEALKELYELLFWPVRIMDLPSFYETITGRIPPSTFSEGWFLGHLKQTEQPIYEKFRQSLDYVAGGILGLATILLLPFIALATKLNSPGPLFYRQKRIGLYGQEFWLYKFRSMYALAEDGGAETGGYQFASKNDERITMVGKFLRKTRLDELPQAWNLLRRDITLIGPRPERPAIVEELTAQMSYYPLRHVVRPGLTGWAVLHQNYTDTLEKSLQKLQYDLFYIKNRSFLLDMSIILRTVNLVVRLLGQ